MIDKLPADIPLITRETDEVFFTVDAAIARATAADAPPEMLALIGEIVMGRTVDQAELQRWGVRPMAVRRFEDDDERQGDLFSATRH